MKTPSKATTANGKSEFNTVDEERQARQEAAEAQMKIYRALLPRRSWQLRKQDQ
jgi:hypothetical protein